METEDAAYEGKCEELRRRVRETELQNEDMVARITQIKKMIHRARLERTILLQQLERSSQLSQNPEIVESPPMSPIIEPASSAAVGSGNGSAANGGKGTKEGGERKRSTPRDPRLPKRPQNAYIIFCDGEKERVKRELEEKDPSSSHDLTRAMSDAWKHLGPSGRKKYTALYKEDRLRYLKEMAAFPSAGLSATDQKEKQRALKQLKEIENNKNESDGGSNDDNDNTEDEDIRTKRLKEEPRSEVDEPASEPPSGL